MKFSILIPFTVETPEGRITLPVGRILELSQDQGDRLGGKVQPIPSDSYHEERRSQQAVTCAGIVYGATPHCYRCQSRDLWQSIHGVTVCRRCHPPMEGAESKAASSQTKD